MNINSSFYYFFSTTPQVLGAILALFGVFVIFKIQSMKSQLFGMGQTIIDDYWIKWGKSNALILNDNIGNDDIITELNLSISRNSLSSLDNTINLVENKEFALYVKSFNNMNGFLKSLVNETILWSAFTSLTLFISLLIIPCGNFLLSHKTLLTTSFIFILICIFMCLVGMLLILIKSIKEINFFMFSWDMRLQGKITEKMLSELFKNKIFHK
ncbi:MAG TPA: hypothetical protein VMT63_04765 [Bacteroidales bacterium]|nr:hypothetical protein [Bacteroidales bacterium]